MKCEKIRIKLSAYMDDEVDAALHEEIADHLKQCLKCREELEELSSVDTLLGGLPQFDMPADFAKIMVSRVQAKAPIVQRQSFPRQVWETLLEYSERFFELLEPQARAGTRSLDEFNDIPASFIGYAYFKALGSRI